jgi:hypothetical protein
LFFTICCWIGLHQFCRLFCVGRSGFLLHSLFLLKSDCNKLQVVLW